MDRHAQHGGARGRGGPIRVRRVEWTDDHGVIELASGTCTLDAGPDQLVIKLVAVDTFELQRMQQMFSARIAMIGRRDDLVVTW